MTRATPANERPAIHMIDEESDKLSGLALSVESRLPEIAELLLNEIERAELHGADDMPAGIVTMMSTVEFVDEGSDTRRTVQLVYPPDADIAQGKISILTPIGAGLIGLSKGQSILWPDREGHKRKLKIVKVSRPKKTSAA
ncbi:MAG TPA: nucleoside diphosphate kinase regulator [Sphingomonadaceae bacterium]|nr:nucleoside diphosphate kinase regulator [Sphingomonadaceae bacterium]